jgi:hypothetical protein
VKSIAVLILATLLAVTGCAVLAQYVIRTCEDMLALKGEIIEAIHQDDFETAMDCLLTIQERWTQLDGPWEMLCNHDDLNAVTAALERSIIVCTYREADWLELECAEIELALENIVHKESLTVSNII